MGIPVSIFNDVLGPVMRGPSSSHTAAAVRIGQLARQLLGEKIKEVFVEFSPDGSLATTYHTQGSDIGLAAGLLGLPLASPDLLHSLTLAAQQGMDIRFEIRDFPSDHPNTYKLTLKSAKGSCMTMTALSTGGGMVSVTEIDGFPVKIYGDYRVLLVYADHLPGGKEGIGEFLKRPEFREAEPESCEVYYLDGRALVQIDFSGDLPQDTLLRFTRRWAGGYCRYADPVLPVHSGKKNRVIFRTATELEASLPCPDHSELWEMALKYESERGHIPEEKVWETAAGLLRVMREAVQGGLKGTVYQNRILQRQSHLVDKTVSERMLDAPLINRISQYTMAVMETKSSFGTIVAAPTAGSCAVLPGAILGCADVCGYTEEETVKAVLAAGAVGVLIACRSTFSAEIAGCQAECGSASGMAAAGIVQLAGGNALTALKAASFALQNTFGMVCDPVGNRVEVPCLGKNMMAAMNGVTAANMCLAGVDAVVPLDQVIAAMDSVGRSLPAALRCTALGGLSVTPVSREIEKRLKRMEE